MYQKWKVELNLVWKQQLLNLAKAREENNLKDEVAALLKYLD